jgi:hypothetical protein
MMLSYDPTAEEISRWPYDPSADEPAQDWDLILSHCPYESLYMEFASSNDCPKQEYVLAVLYLIVGDAVRTRYRTRSREDVERLLAEAEERFPSHWLHLWTKRARELIAGHQAFSYDDWCAGALARDCDA